MKERSPIKFREYAGILCAFIVVMAFVCIGYFQIGLTIWRGVPVVIPGDWSAAMLSLASAALGFLIGKQVSTPGDGSAESTAGYGYAPSLGPPANCPNPDCPLKPPAGQ